MADKKKNRYRNPANDLVDYAEGGIRNALLGIRNSAASSLRGSAAAARRTRERLEREAANDRSLKAKVVRKNQPTPPKKIDASKYDMDSEPPKAPSKNKAKPKPAEVKPAKPPVRGSEQRTTTTKASTTKPKPKPSSKPMEKAYGESGKDLYQASKKNNPLMQRTFGYQTGDAPDQKKKSADEKPASKRGGAANSDLKIDSSKAAPFNDRGLFGKDKKKEKKPASGGSSYA